MKYLIILFLAFSLNSHVSAQLIKFDQLESQLNDPEFNGVWFGSVAFADVDGDNDQDVIITGSTSIPSAELYLNDGNGVFVKKAETPFIKVKNSSVAFADVDGDGDQDLLITGRNDASTEAYAKLYINDGSGEFTLALGTPFVGVQEGAVAFEDVDNDNDIDLLISGKDKLGSRIVNLYLNNGNGIFISKLGTPFIGVSRSSVAFSDIDNDGDYDLLITGKNNSNAYTSKLYRNLGSAEFIEDTEASFTGVTDGAIAFGDVDGDNDQDVLITGYSSSGRISKLYLNDSDGIFVEDTENQFTSVFEGEVLFVDVDGDNDLDVFLTGSKNYENNSNIKSFMAKLYINNGSGKFTELEDTPFKGVRASTVAFADIDGDNDQDLLITGLTTLGSKIASLYSNNGNGKFTEIKSVFDKVRGGTIDFADVDGDNDLDVIITGKRSTFESITKLYSNDGSGVYSEVTNTPFEGVNSSSVGFSDVDGDMDIDVLISGWNNENESITKLYSNDGEGNYSLVSGTTFEGARRGALAFADVDGDGDEDVLITGKNSLNEPIAILYFNSGDGLFTEAIGTPFEGSFSCAVAFADIDGDNDFDVLISGWNSSPSAKTKLYINDGIGNFTEKQDTPFVGVYSNSVSFADVDSDGDQDLLITGLKGSGVSITELYTNNGAGEFIKDNKTIFQGINGSSTGFADVDGDSDLDVLMVGRDGISGSGTLYAILYTNDGNGAFTKVENMPFEGAYDSSVSFADVDNDNDLDVMITGLRSNNMPMSKLYFNTSCTPGLPQVDAETLATLSGECSFIPATIPSATNNCGDTFYGDSNISFPITEQGTTIITWMFDDGNGNTITQTQNIIIQDISAPIPDLESLVDVSTECPVSSLTPPTAMDNCKGAISGIHNVELPIDQQGTTIITWTFDDGNGNTVTQTQNIIIQDISTPVPDIESLPDIISDCSVSSLTPPTATDNCKGSVLGTHNTELPITEQGTTIITWTFDDGDGNLVTQNQSATFTPIDNGISQNEDNLSANAEGLFYQWIDCNNNLPITSETNRDFVPTITGSYAVEISNSSCSVVSECMGIVITGVYGNKSEMGVLVYPNPAINEIQIDKGSNKQIEIQIIDSNGVLIVSKTSTNQLTLIDIRKYSPGIYFVIVQSDTQVLSRKITKTN